MIKNIIKVNSNLNVYSNLRDKFKINWEDLNYMIFF